MKRTHPDGIGVQGNMRLNRRTLYFPAVTLTALTITLTVILAISTYRNFHREQEQMEESLTREGLALLRLFKMVTHSQSHTLEEEAAQVQRLAQSIAPNEDIARIYLFDQQGTILAHTDPRQVGTRIDGGIPKGDEILTLRRNDTFERLCEIRSAFHPASDESARDHYLGICLKVNALEQAHHEDRRHTMMMAAMLILLGSGSLFFILVVQNFYLVQRTLNQMKSYIHYVVESMANGLVSLDADGTVTTVNPAASKLIGVSENEAKRLSVDELFDGHAGEIKNVLQNDNTILNKEIAYQPASGSRVPINLSATQVKDDSGNKLGAVILLHDLREVKELRERAVRAEHLASIGRMAATVAHEIRNPLSSIRGFAQYFATLFPKENEEWTYAQAMIEESNRLNRVVSELLSYARPLELNLDWLSIQTLFEDTIRTVALEKEAQGIEVTQSVEAEIPRVLLDRDRMLQVLLNLTQNSIDAMPDGGKLTLKAVWMERQQCVQVSVEDTGKGVSKADLPRLFEPFFTTKAQGTGLGLAIVRKIVDAHRGEVDVRSEEGVGTKVILVLPQSGDAEKAKRGYH